MKLFVFSCLKEKMEKKKKSTELSFLLAYCFKEVVQVPFEELCIEGSIP